MLFRPSLSSSDVQRELALIAIEPKSSLRERYVTLHGCEPPKAFGPDLLRRSVAQKLQENAFGGLSRSRQRELDRLVATYIAKPDATLTLTRRAQSGTVLVRDWKGKSHRVMIVDDGFAYEERVFASLSEIARLITGTRWNGPRFFGLRRTPPGEPGQPRRAATAKPAPSPASRKRRRAGHGL